MALFLLSCHSSYSVTALFTQTVESKCSPVIVTFKNLSSGKPGTIYLWNFGQGSIINSNNSTLRQMYTEPGTYKITLTAIDGIEKDSMFYTLEVSKGPKAIIGADNTVGCVPFKINLSNNSTPGSVGIKTVKWDFRNGTIINGNNVQYEYKNAGQYSILMSVTDSNDCSDMIELNNYIKAVGKPVADFTASDTFACEAPVYVTFFNRSKGTQPLSYKWDFGNGTTSEEVSSSVFYSDVDSFNVKLKVTDANGCSDSVLKIEYIRVGIPKNEIYTKLNDKLLEFRYWLCPGNITFGSKLKTDTGYVWNVQYNNNTYTSFSDEIKIPAYAPGDISGTLRYGIGTHCPNEIPFSRQIILLKADFVVDNPEGCQYPHKVNLTNYSQGAFSYTWLFNDQIISTDKNLSYSINEPLTYKQLFSHEINSKSHDFALIAEDTLHCTDTVHAKVRIKLPVAVFSPDTVSGCVPLKVTLSDSSKSASNIKKWVYKIDNDSVVSFTGDTAYVFNKPGNYSVKLITRNVNECVDTSYTIEIKAGTKSTPDFNVSKNTCCYGDTVFLDGSSNISNNDILWRYSSVQTFNTGFIHSPDTFIIIKSGVGGPKDINLEADYNGCISQISKSSAITLNGPLGNFIKSMECSDPFSYTFISEIKPATTLTWEIDTFILHNEDTVKYTFPANGIYNVRLSAEDMVSGCKLIRNNKIGVRNVVADFNIKTFYCLGDSTNFNAIFSKDYINKCYNEGFLWDFNDNRPPRRTYDPLYIYTYSNKGTFRPLLTVYADNGCTDTLSKPVTILRPEAQFEIDKDSGCGPELKVNFTNTSEDTSIVDWFWFFDDGKMDLLSKNTVEHTYHANNNTFFPALRVRDFYGCFGQSKKTILITTPSAGFQALDNAICLGETVTFNKSDSNLQSFTWDFGDNTTSNTNDVHLYNKTGKFNVTLSVTKNGCSKSHTRNNYISVESASAWYNVNDSIFDCYPDTVHFRHIDASQNYVQRDWTFGTGLPNNNNSPSADFIYSLPGIYNTSLTTRTINGCRANQTKIINITGPRAYFSFNPKIICYGDTVTFRIDSLRDVNTYTWFYGDGETGAPGNTTHKYLARGTINPGIIVENENCTTKVLAGNLYVSRVVANYQFVNNKNVVCLGDLLRLSNRSEYNTSSLWKLNNSFLSDKRFLDSVEIEIPGKYRLKLEAADNYNCIDSISKDFYIIKPPSFDIKGKTEICRDIDSSLLTVTSEPTWSINWYPTAGLNDPFSFSPKASPDTTTKYVAVVKDTSGCYGIDTVELVVNQPYNLISFPQNDTTINIGEPANLLVISSSENVDYWWTPGYKISCRKCNNPIVMPFEDYIYKVTIKDKCFEKEKSFTIKVVKNYYLEAPDAFTPNNDGNNDLFHFEYENIKLFKLKIFNRWGSIVYETDDIEKGWDGTYNGKEQNIDTYSYIVNAETVSGYKFEKKGTVVLLK